MHLHLKKFILFIFNKKKYKQYKNQSVLAILDSIRSIINISFYEINGLETNWFYENIKDRMKDFKTCNIFSFNEIYNFVELDIKSSLKWFRYDIVPNSNGYEYYDITQYIIENLEKIIKSLINGDIVSLKNDLYEIYKKN